MARLLDIDAHDARTARLARLISTHDSAHAGTRRHFLDTAKDNISLHFYQD